MKLHYWYAVILTITALTVLFTYTIPGGSPLVFLNYVFGFFFVSFVPGYCLSSLLFAARENKLDNVEEIVLSVALSFGIAGLSGLFLGLSPIGMSFDTIRISLVAIAIVLASLAYVRKRQVMRASDVKL